MHRSLFLLPLASYWFFSTAPCFLLLPCPGVGPSRGPRPFTLPPVWGHLFPTVIPAMSPFYTASTFLLSSLQVDLLMFSSMCPIFCILLCVLSHISICVSSHMCPPTLPGCTSHPQRHSGTPSGTSCGQHRMIRGLIPHRAPCCQSLPLTANRRRDVTT